MSKYEVYWLTAILLINSLACQEVMIVFSFKKLTNKCKEKLVILQAIGIILIKNKETRAVLKKENSLKSISTINPAITENMECSIVKVHASFINLKVGNHGVSLCFVSLLAFRICWATFQANNNVRSAPASSALTLVLHQSHNVSTANRHLCNSG